MTPGALQPSQLVPGKAALTPSLGQAASSSHTSQHSDPAPLLQLQGGQVTRGHCLQVMGMRFIALCCFFCCEKGRSITGIRRKQGDSLEPEPSLDSSLAPRSSRHPQQHRKTKKWAAPLLHSSERSALCNALAKYFIPSD